MEHFAGYGFNKSHSTAYALLAYQTAYLKANYPWHFAAALLTIEAQNTDKLAVYLGECRERGVPVLPPDINESELRFTVDARRRALRAHGDQERRRRRDSSRCSRCARRRGASRRCTRSARISICVSSTSACSRAWSRPERSTRLPATPGSSRSRRRRCGRASLPASTRRASTAPGFSATRAKDRRSCLAPSAPETVAAPGTVLRWPLTFRRRRHGPRPSSSPSRRRRSASTGADTRSTATAAS